MTSPKPRNLFSQAKKYKPIDSLDLGTDFFAAKSTTTTETEVELASYPKLIAAAERNRNILTSLLKRYKLAVIDIEAQIDLQVASDPELTNADKRKAEKRNLLASNSDYQLKLLKAQEAEESLAEAECEYNRLRNEFGVLKIERWTAIADKLDNFSR